VQRAADLIGDTVTALAAVASSSRATASRVVNLLHSLETYVARQAELIMAGSAARDDAAPISTAPTETIVQWQLHRRMGANQQMCGSPRGAHMMLKIRTAVAKGTVEQDFATAERWARRSFRRAARPPDFGRYRSQLSEWNEFPIGASSSFLTAGGSICHGLGTTAAGRVGYADLRSAYATSRLPDHD
jgi:hypothetical protein